MLYCTVYSTVQCTLYSIKNSIAVGENSDSILVAVVYVVLFYLIADDSGSCKCNQSWAREHFFHRDNDNAAR